MYLPGDFSLCFPHTVCSNRVAHVNHDTEMETMIHCHRLQCLTLFEVIIPGVQDPVIMFGVYTGCLPVHCVTNHIFLEIVS
jgi:hypothetical protein